MQQLIDISKITLLHKQCIPQWKLHGITPQYKEFYQLVEENHSFNFQLWHAEDKARRDDMGYEFVYRAKREIDHCNQLRNNSMEALDEYLFHQLQPENTDDCPVHSESPGMILDRLSILALKAYHMELQTTRQEVSEEHRLTCKHKLQSIERQLAQLAQCLEELYLAVQNKTRTFRIHHQFKMYNDPMLNPELYCTD